MSGVVKATKVEAVMKLDDSEQTEDGRLWRHDLAPGSWTFGYDMDNKIAAIDFVCPCGCGSVGVLPIRDGFGGPRWTWDGNNETPTLTPSVQKTSGCKWHGHLVAGEWRPA